MANLKETNYWEEGIYQFETSDPVMGGETGIDNKPTRQLANRTLYLKTRLETLQTDVADKTIDATAEKAGIAKLNNTLNSEETDAALTAAKGKELNDKINANANTAQTQIAQAAPSGAILYFAQDTAPQGWLKANGAAVSRKLYENLFNAIGTRFGAGDGNTTFNLPDLRGEFLRGWDDGRGVDSGRGVGTAQGDAIRNITGFVNDMHTGVVGDASGAFSWNKSGTRDTLPINSTGLWQYGSLNLNASKIVPTATENRPRNIALLACIKI